jgi:hypothetical protein
MLLSRYKNSSCYHNIKKLNKKSIQNGLARLDYDQLKNVSLVTDAADAITNGFKYTFDENFKRGNCSFHVIKDIDKYLSIIGNKSSKKKFYICKHMVSLAASQKLYIIPEQAKIVPIGKKSAR